MSDQDHDLASEFPESRDILHRLKIESAHFQTLSARYHPLIKEIARIESGAEAASDERLEERKKQRLALLDEIAAMIAQARQKA